MAVRLPALFSDHAVLQRNIPLRVWGWAEPGEMVSVMLAGNEARAAAGPDGAWEVTLPAQPAGGPLEMTVSGSDTVVVHDLLVGEVWIGSGQSNMEFNVGSSDNSGHEIETAHYPRIRLFTVPKTAATETQTDVDGCWALCSPATVSDFSAVLFFFGRMLHEQLDIPFGLIHTSWGGTVAEAWTSRDGLLADPAVRDIVESYERDLPQHEAQMAEYLATLNCWNDRLSKDPGNTALAQGWADPGFDTVHWDWMDLPTAWQQAGLDISGVVWFRREVEIPKEWAGRELTLRIGACDKSDVCYFNGTEVGRMSYLENANSWCTPRAYPVPGTLARAGKAVIAVRVYSHCYAGGLLGPETEMRLEVAGAVDMQPIVLGGRWQFAIEHNFGRNPDMPLQPLGPGNPNSPHTLYDGMIAPLIPYPICGAIWYQGESNATRALQYRALFRALIRDWRRVWGQGDFPFYFVQLANYNATPPQPNPADSDWPLLREAQRLALQEPNTGMAVIIDVGDAVDIHPRNKQDVGRRLALQALAGTFGQQIVHSGPLFRAMTVEAGAIRLAFDHVGSGLHARDGRLSGFAIAGADRRFVWAEARIDGDTVLVSSSQVTEPVAVRYAWADNPPCTLYNRDGLPASPFRTDDWPALVEAAV